MLNRFSQQSETHGNIWNKINCHHQHRTSKCQKFCTTIILGEKRFDAKKGVNLVKNKIATN